MLEIGKRETYINACKFLYNVMKLKILNEDKNKIKVEIKGETHTFCNTLKNKLWENKHIKTAGYNIDHPLTGIPILNVETDGVNPRKALSDAAKSMAKDMDYFKSAFNKGIKW